MSKSWTIASIMKEDLSKIDSSELQGLVAQIDFAKRDAADADSIHGNNYYDQLEGAENKIREELNSRK